MFSGAASVTHSFRWTTFDIPSRWSLYVLLTSDHHWTFRMSLQDSTSTSHLPHDHLWEQAGSLVLGRLFDLLDSLWDVSLLFGLFGRLLTFISLSIVRYKTWIVNLRLGQEHVIILISLFVRLRSEKQSTVRLSLVCRRALANQITLSKIMNDRVDGYHDIFQSFNRLWSSPQLILKLLVRHILVLLFVH